MEVRPTPSHKPKYIGFPVYSKYDVILYFTFSVHKSAAVITRSTEPTTLHEQ
jgi:hypothetical protein